LIWKSEEILRTAFENHQFIIVTAPAENNDFGSYLHSVLQTAETNMDKEYPEKMKKLGWPLLHPEEDINVLTRILPLPTFSGVSVHGDGPIFDEIKGLLGRLGKCIVVRGSQIQNKALLMSYRSVMDALSFG
jgi:hypothetical protein